MQIPFVANLEFFFNEKNYYKIINWEKCFKGDCELI